MNETFDALEGAFSPERMRTYLAAARGNRPAAGRLYTWNTAVSAAFYGPLQGLEIALRNGMHRRLAAQYGAVWYETAAAGLDDACLRRIAETKRELKRKRRHRELAPSDMVANLPFGFWVALLGHGGRIERDSRADYERTLWRPALRFVFRRREPLRRKKAHKVFDYLRMFRNRIAHHEPIFARHLRKDYERILEATEWISPPVRLWVESHSRVPELLERFEKDAPDFHARVFHAAHGKS